MKFYYPVPTAVCKKSELLQCLENTDLPVFAYDKGADGSKRFFAAEHDHFVREMYLEGKRNMCHVYEVLRADIPSRVYVDFDGPVDKISREDFVAVCALFTHEIQKKAEAILGAEPGAPVVLEASTERKHSRHLVFPDLCLANVHQVGEFVHEVRRTSTCKQLDAVLDTKVYTKNRCFRIAYSYKKGKAPESALRILNATRTPENVLRSLIQREPETVWTFNGTSSARNGTAPLSTHFLCQQVRDIIGSNVLAVRESGDGLVQCIVAGKVCPWARRVHKNNNTFVTFSKNRLSGWSTCADPECPKAQYDVFNLTDAFAVRSTTN